MTVALRAFLDRHSACALVTIVEALGSTPREAGAWMLVAPDETLGTIGGGQLEFMAIARARDMLAASPFPPGGGSHRDAPRGGGEEQLDATPTPDLRSGPPHNGEGGRPTADLMAGAAATPPGGFAATVASRGRKSLAIPLGPEIGQCCGGRVELDIEMVDDAMRQTLLARAAAEEAACPHVYVFGGGHVGQALAASLALMPLRVTLVETRAEALENMPPSVETRLTAVPEAAVFEAPPGTAFVVLTHDHALDFLIAAEALKRGDAAYVGMIGSKTKRATFRSWFLREGGGTEAQLAALVSPIGGGAVKDKRPAVIAALAAAEIVTALLAS